MVSNKSILVSKLFSEYTDKGLINTIEIVLKEYKDHNSIPLNIYSDKKLGILEATVKYLKEDSNLSYHEIAIILNRDDRTIWATYRKALKKHRDKFSISSGETVDPDIFSNRDIAPLGALIAHLKNKGMTLKNISMALNRSYKNIWMTDNKRDK
jgi:hypothetical protein